MTNDEFGDVCKAYEAAYERTAMRGLPLLARLDGRAFHSYTRGLPRPYDARFMRCMTDTVLFLIERTHALVGYTQSDEISLAWFHPAGSRSEYDFGGRIQKLASSYAALASVCFAQLAEEHLPERRGYRPTFDCRVWQVPNLRTASEVFVWREDDATKNSVTMAASAYYSHRELQNKNSADKHDLLHARGVNWAEYPTHFKRGVYLRRQEVCRPFSLEELERIPEQFRPTALAEVTRNVVDVLDLPPIRSLPWEERVERLFGKGIQ